jgi:kumamolisin
MAITDNFKPVAGSERVHAASHQVLNPTAAGQTVTATLILRRTTHGQRLKKLEEFSPQARTPRSSLSRADFAANHGADPAELAAVENYAKSQGLTVVETNASRRSVVVSGTAAQMNKAFAVQLHDYDSPRGKYHGHTGPAQVPAAIAETVEAVIGLDNRKIPATHFAKRKQPNDPPNTVSVTPQEVATLYNFPAPTNGGAGAGQTIGLYEMETGSGPAGYALSDITSTMKAFGLPLPKITDVSVDGVTNSGASDGETGLDITVAGAIAQAAEIAVYFTGGTSQSIVHALQSMVHPDAGAPQPGIVSISYGWGPDDPSAHSFSTQDLQQITQLFQDAANLNITVLVSSGDSGAFIESKTQAQTSYPASEPWVTACGGTTIGDEKAASFVEYVWNDSGATGGGISAQFPIPSYQSSVNLPKRNHTGTAGRGVPDIAGNASPFSGYTQFINGRSEPIGGTSAVAPLYAGLIAIINSNLGVPAGFLNPALYSAADNAFRSVSGPPGPANNTYDKVTGYAATKPWNACTGFGSVNGAALQNLLKTTLAAGQ